MGQLAVYPHTADRGRTRPDWESRDYQYDYPTASDGSQLDFSPKSKLSKRICMEIEMHKRASKRVTEGSHWEWRRMEETLSSFVHLSAAERAAKDRDFRTPVATVIPHSLASLETFLAYMMQAFIKEEIHKYRGWGGPESIARAILRQRVIARYGPFFKEPLKLLSWWRSAFTYGSAVVGLNWTKHRTRRPVDHRMNELTEALLRQAGMEGSAGDIVRLMEEVTEWEGTSLTNIDVWNAFYDPKMTSNEFQKSEFFGYLYEDHPFDLLRREEDPEEQIFNAKYVRDASEQGAALDPDWNHYDTGRHRRQGLDGVKDEINAPLSNRAHFTVWAQRLIPSEWELGDSDYPETWIFLTCANKIVCQAHPLDEEHGMLPFAICAPNTDGHDVLPVSHLATTFGIQEALDWLIRSRMHNVMTAVHNMFVYNPQMIESDDLFEPGPAKYIRLKPGAYNMQGNLDAYLKQLQVNDVTQSHYGDIQTLMAIAKDANGTVDIIKGDMSSLPERPGQAGVMGAMHGAVSRMRKMAMVISAQGMYDVAYMHGKNLDQYMDEQVWIDILGDDEKDLRQMFGAEAEQASVGPFDLDGSWHVVPHQDQSERVETFNIVTQVMQTLMQTPEVAQEIAMDNDIGRVFRYWAELGGFRNINEFRRSRPAIGLASDQYVAQERQAGNLLTHQEAQGL